MESGHYVDRSIWWFAPNKAAPIFFLLAFALSFAWHLHQCIHFKSWKFTGLFPWAALIFVAGYGLREVGAFHYDNIDVFIAAICLVYAAPPVCELANYIILGRILYYIPYHSPLHPGRVITTFGGLSAVVEALTANGAAYSSNHSLPESKRETGRSLLKAALILQLFVLAAFLVLAASFHRRCKRAGLLPGNLRRMLLTLYALTGIILVRTVFRTVEYFLIEGTDFGDTALTEDDFSPLMRYEWFFYVFEAVPMFVNTFLMNWFHPAKYLPRSNKVFLAQDGVTEVEGPGYSDKRFFLLTILDPFDIGSLIVRKKRGEKLKKYWEQGQERDSVVRNLGDGSGDGKV